MFIIKWIVGNLLMPLPLMLILIIIGLVLIKFNKKKSGISTVLFSITSIFLLSIQPVAFALLSPLEFKNPVYQNQPVEFIHVLGNGHIEDDSLPITSQLSYISTLRVVEAVRIWNINPDAQLLLSGYRSFANTRSTASMHRQLALDLGVDASKIRIFESPRDTEEEIKTIKSVTNDSPVAVVTTANHMRRAMGYYDKYEVNAFSAPTMHLSRSTALKFNISKLHPQGKYLQMSTMAIHEYLGILWQKLRK